MLEQCSLCSFPSARGSRGKMLILPSHFTIYPTHLNAGCTQTEVPRGSVSETQPIISGITLASIAGPVNYLPCPVLLLKRRLSFKQTKPSRAVYQFRRGPVSRMSRQRCRACSHPAAAPLCCHCSQRTGLSPPQPPAQGPLASPCKHPPSSPACACTYLQYMYFSRHAHIILCWPLFLIRCFNFFFLRCSFMRNI